MRNITETRDISGIRHPIVSSGGAATHVLIPIDEYLALYRPDIPPAGYTFVPNDVARRVSEGVNPLRAWRVHKRLTQERMAELMGISRPAYTQMERSENPHANTLKKAAEALDIEEAQLVELYDECPVSVPPGVDTA